MLITTEKMINNLFYFNYFFLKASQSYKKNYVFVLRSFVNFDPDELGTKKSFAQKIITLEKYFELQSRRNLY